MLALSIQNLEKTYRNGHHALKGINLDVEEGDFFALLGPNGAGKSTAIGIICSLVNKSAGRVDRYLAEDDRIGGNRTPQERRCRPAAERRQVLGLLDVTLQCNYPSPARPCKASNN